MTHMPSLAIRRRSASFEALPHYLALLAGFALLALTVLGPWMSYKPEPYTGEGSPLRQICYFLVFALALIAARPIKNFKRLVPVSLTLALALLWCWASLLWAIAPDTALRRLLLTTIVIWMTFLIVDELGYQKVMKLIRAALVVALIANYLAVILFPQTGIHQFEPNVGAGGFDPGLVGDWRGVMRQKNFAGVCCSFTLLTFVLDAGRMRMWVRLLVIGAALLFLIKSGSKTSMGLSFIGLVAGVAYIRYNPAYRIMLIPLIAVVGAGAYLFAVTHWEALTAPLYDQTAFTGRTQIWPPLLAYAREHPIFGSGYGSFWNIGFGKGPIYEYSKGWVLHVIQGHNGYLDLLVSIGAPGLILVVLATIIVPIGRLLASQSVSRQAGALLLAMVLFCAGHNLTESSLFDRDAIVQTFLMFAVALIYKLTRTPKLPATQRRQLPFQRTPAHD